MDDFFESVTLKPPKIWVFSSNPSFSSQKWRITSNSSFSCEKWSIPPHFVRKWPQFLGYVHFNYWFPLKSPRSIRFHTSSSNYSFKHQLSIKFKSTLVALKSRTCVVLISNLCKIYFPELIYFKFIIYSCILLSLKKIFGLECLKNCLGFSQHFPSVNVPDLESPYYLP